MIRRVHIAGFQSLADVDLELGGFTVIQGRSNSGKSAVIRALRAVVSNGGNLRGTGGSYINHRSSKVVVEIERTDGKLVWTKSPKKTTYDLDGRPFTTGQEVPEEVASFLRMGDIVIDEPNNLKVNVNFQGGARGQGQFEPPFLVVDRTGSYLAKVMALLTSANMLYAAQAIAKKDSRAKSDKLKTLREVHEANTSKLTDLQAAYAPLHATVEKASALSAEIQETRSAISDLEGLQSGYTAALSAHTAVEAQLTQLGSVDLSAESRILELQQQVSAYQQWHESITTLRSSVADLEAQLEGHDLGDVKVKLAEIDALQVEQSALIQWQAAIEGLQQQVSGLETLIGAESVQLEAAQHDLHELLGSLEECPTCSQPIDLSKVRL